MIKYKKIKKFNKIWNLQKLKIQNIYKKLKKKLNKLTIYKKK